jgi:hypothetical protein
MTVWILTIVLVGTTIQFADGKPFASYKDCKEEGLRQVRDYQEGNIRAVYECEEHEASEVSTPAGKDV